MNGSPPRVMRGLAAVALPLVLLVGAGCGATTAPDAVLTPAPVVTRSQVPEVSQSSTPTEQSTRGTDKVATKYFSALATNDSYKEGNAQAYAAPKSLAAAYALHLSTVDGALLDGGNPDDPDDLTVANGLYEDCPDHADPGSDQCTRWENVKFSNGKVSDFTVNGVDIHNRITLGSGDAINAGNYGEVKFISAYQSVTSKAVYVSFEFTSKKRPISLGTGDAKYRDLSGRQATATDNGGPSEVDPDSSVRAFMVFKGAKPGGVVTLDLINTKTYDDTHVKINTG